MDIEQKLFGNIRIDKLNEEHTSLKQRGHVSFYSIQIGYQSSELIAAKLNAVTSNLLLNTMYVSIE